MSNFQSKKKLDKSISVLIPDGESHLLGFVVNCLSSVQEIKIHVLSSIKQNAHRFSRHISTFSYYPKTDNDQKWIKYIEETVQKYKIDIVMPVFEIGIRRVIKNRSLFNANINLVSLPNLETFTTAINKWKLIEHCRSQNIAIPDSCLLYPEDQNKKKALSNLTFPVILKPLEGFGGGMGIKDFNTIEEVEVYLDKIKYPVLVQQFIKGYDIDCSVLVEDGDIIAFTIQQGNLKGSEPFMPQVGVKFTYNEELYKVVEELMESLHWNGVAHIDMRYDTTLNNFVVIEVNPRYWATMDGSYLMGVNFPYLAVLQARREVFEVPKYKQDDYLNLKGVVKKTKKNPLFSLRWNFIYNNTQLRFVLLDPIPTVFKFIDRTKNIILKKIKGR